MASNQAHLDIKLFTGTANPHLAEQVAKALNLPLGDCTVGRFSDGEVRVEILESIRGSHALIIQSTCAPCNESLMELIIMADALRRASAASITALVPYFGYARQDRRVRSSRVPITAKVVADMMASVGIGRLITVDLHAEQIQGFFSMPVDNIYSTPVILPDIKAKNLKHMMVVSPDVGGVVQARAFAKRLNTDLAIIDKRRQHYNQSEVMNVIGDVSGRDCIIIDDIVDTAGTLCNAANALKEHGAKTVQAYCTHPVLSGAAIDNITRSVLDEVIVTDTIALSDRSRQCEKIRQISVAGLLAETVVRINQRESVSSLFKEE